MECLIIHFALSLLFFSRVACTLASYPYVAQLLLCGD
jgi:hypothetical protein